MADFVKDIELNNNDWIELKCQLSAGGGSPVGVPVDIGKTVAIKYKGHVQMIVWAGPVKPGASENDGWPLTPNEVLIHTVESKIWGKGYGLAHGSIATV
jgi:hypothetical protein